MEEKKGFFARLKNGLSKPRDNIVRGIDSVFSGFSDIDYDFYETLVEAPNLLATFAGHVHVYGTDIIKGRPHYTVAANHSGAYYEVTVMPLKR